MPLTKALRALEIAEGAIFRQTKLSLEGLEFSFETSVQTDTLAKALMGIAYDSAFRERAFLRKFYISYGSWGPRVRAFLKSAARVPRIKAVRGTIREPMAIKGSFDN